MKEYDFIFINGRFLEQKLTGVQRFDYETVKEIDKLLSKDIYEPLKNKTLIISLKKILKNMSLRGVMLLGLNYIKKTFWILMMILNLI